MASWVRFSRPLLASHIFPVLAIPAASVLLGGSLRPWWDYAVAAAGLAAASQIRVAGSSGNRLTTGIAVAVCLPLVFRSGQIVDLPSVVGVYAAGLSLNWVVDTLRGRPPVEVLVDSVRRWIGFSVFALVLKVSMPSFLADVFPEGWEAIGPLAVATMVLLGIDVTTWALTAHEPRQLNFRYLSRLALKDSNVFVALVATGSLLGIAFGSISWWALTIALLPYVFAHNAFRRFQSTRRTYRQTIRALARIPEVAGLATEGHADRTTALAVEVAGDLGLSPNQVADVEYTALMHDIGRIALNEPFIVRRGYTEADIAGWGAEIISEAPYLQRVAEFVRLQHQPYRRPGEEKDPDLPMTSKVIKACSAFDHAIADQGMSPLEAMEVLHRGAAYDYDPEVVGALRKLLDRRGVLSRGRH